MQIPPDKEGKLEFCQGEKMIILNILQGVSLNTGEKLLLEEGYIAEECIEKNDTSCDKLFLYPYCLYDTQGKNLIVFILPNIVIT